MIRYYRLILFHRFAFSRVTSENTCLMKDITYLELVDVDPSPMNIMTFFQRLTRYVFLFLFIGNSANALTEKDDILKDLRFNKSATFDSLSIRFNGQVDVEFGNTIGLGNLKEKPQVDLNNFQDSEFHTLAMVDPDAPSRENPCWGVSKI